MTVCTKLSVPAVLLAVLVVAMAPPSTAGASSRQFTIFQDDGVFLGHTRHDPNEAMAEAKVFAEALQLPALHRRSRHARSRKAPPRARQSGRAHRLGRAA